MKRHEWAFEYTARKLREPAAERAKHHREREQFWASELATAEKELREHGVEFRDQPVTGGQRLDVMLDPQRSARVNECRSKSMEHRTRAEEYEAWERLFALQQDSDAFVRLDIDDVKYFGL